MNLLRAGFVLLLAGAIAVVVHAWIESTPAAAPPVAVPRDDADRQGEEPDLRLGGATITEFSATGKVRFRLDAEAMARYENEDETLLGAPRLLLLQESGSPPWDVESREGVIRQVALPDGRTESMVLLRRDVVLRQIDKVTRRPALTIRSESMDLFPERQFATTRSDVMIDSDVGRTQATGMEGDLKTGKLLLSSQPERPVHTIVLPTQFKNQTAS